MGTREKAAPPGLLPAGPRAGAGTRPRSGGGFPRVPSTSVLYCPREPGRDLKTLCDLGPLLCCCRSVRGNLC